MDAACKLGYERQKVRGSGIFGDGVFVEKIINIIVENEPGSGYSSLLRKLSPLPSEAL
jgi:hypothetical protein